MQEHDKDPYQIKKNFIAIAVFVVVILLAVDIVLRVRPEILRPEAIGGSGYISAVGHEYEFEDGSHYYIYTIFENNGDVYQCWWDEKTWKQKKVTNYKGETHHSAEK